MASQYNRKDKYYQEAKECGYRSRAAFKLLEIQKKHKILPKGGSVLDLGCFPGGWLQIASEALGPKGCVLGVDLRDVEPLPNKGAPVHILKGDLLDEKSKEWIREVHPKQFDAIVSDMSPHLSGIKYKDQVAAAELFELALAYCEEFLKAKGCFVAKVFPSEETEAVFRSTKKKWEKLVRMNLDSTRSSSNELYIIGKSYLAS